MFFESWSDFFHMGGYGFYVWLAYGISFAAVLALGIQSYRDRHVVLREVKREQQREQRLRTTKQDGTL